MRLLAEVNSSTFLTHIHVIWRIEFKDEDIALANDFYKVDYLPENDRVRYTISTDARKEVLKRLLCAGHGTRKGEPILSDYGSQGTWTK